jgi:hypothetical protein
MAGDAEAAEAYVVELWNSYDHNSYLYRAARFSSEGLSLSATKDISTYPTRVVSFPMESLGETLSNFFILKGLGVMVCAYLDWMETCPAAALIILDSRHSRFVVVRPARFSFTVIHS